MNRKNIKLNQKNKEKKERRILRVDNRAVKNTFWESFKFLWFLAWRELFALVVGIKFAILPKSAEGRGLPFNKIVIWVMVTLSVIGFACLYSSYTYRIFQNEDVILGILPISVIKQLAFFAISWYIYIFMYRKFNVYYLKNNKFILFLIFAAMIVFTIVAGHNSNTSAKRWINLGPITIQTAEIGKIIFPLIFAYLFTIEYKPYLYLKKFFSNWVVWMYLAVSALILGIVFKLMPDTGTTIAYVIIFICCLSVAKLKPKVMSGINFTFIVVVTGAIVAVVFLPNLMTKLVTTSKFQGNRITMFLNPFVDVKNEGYQLVSSITAIAKGSLMGAGLGNGTQKLGWLPETESDFIFANVAEELGLVGVIVISTLFLILFIQLWKKVSKIEDNFLQILAFGLLSGIYANILINLGGISGSMPLSGVPLPFFSSGVTNLLITFVSIALIQNCINTDNVKRRGFNTFSTLKSSIIEHDNIKRDEKKQRKLRKQGKIVKVRKGETPTFDSNVKVKKIKKQRRNAKKGK